MSEDFVDVTWRGLEVVRKARLRSTGARTAYVEHGTPMPTGSQLAIRTADGHELHAIVARVQEQIGGRTEPPGMEVRIEATGAAATWWLARAEAAAHHEAAVPATVEDEPRRVAARPTMVMPIGAVPVSAPPTMPPPSPEAPAAQAAPGVPVAAPETGPTRPSQRPADDTRTTDPMAAVPELADAGDAIPTGIDDSVDRPGDPVIVDDGKRTMIMPAVDIEAIVAAAGRPDSEPPDDDGGGASAAGGGDRKKARGKRRRGR